MTKMDIDVANDLELRELARDVLPEKVLDSIEQQEKKAPTD